MSRPGKNGSHIIMRLALARRGIKSQTELARASGLDQMDISRFLKPGTRHFRLIRDKLIWSKKAVMLADFLFCLPQDIFYHPAPTISSIKEVLYESPDSAVELQVHLDDDIALVLAELTLRERFIINARFGIASPPMTLQHIAAIQGCTRERIKQIEVKALKKLRGPRVSGDLRKYWSMP
jgi:hypothetical protein